MRWVELLFCVKSEHIHIKSLHWSFVSNCCCSILLIFHRKMKYFTSSSCVYSWVWLMRRLQEFEVLLVHTKRNHLNPAEVNDSFQTGAVYWWSQKDLHVQGNHALIFTHSIEAKGSGHNSISTLGGTTEYTINCKFFIFKNFLIIISSEKMNSKIINIPSTKKERMKCERKI